MVRRVMALSHAWYNDRMNHPEDPNQLPEPIRPGSPALVVEGVALPAIVLAAGEEAARHFLNFFIASICNRNTRRAHARQARDFLRWSG